MSATAFPLVLSFILLGTLVFIGTAGADFDVADLEWWSRFGAWVLIAATVWFDRERRGLRRAGGLPLDAGRGGAVVEPARERTPPP